jgi:pyruvate/2-oxoglutarate dehydrogenase complex dihydrolipoamide acyltransferase (E2) component
MSDILMPALSPTMTEGKLARWLKKPGDAVAPGDVIAEIETDKAMMEVEAIDEGTMGEIKVPEGTEGVAVNAVIATLLGGDEKPAPKKAAPAAPAPQAEKAAPEAKATEAPAPKPVANGHA